MKSFLETGESRQTCPEIMQAIMDIAHTDEIAVRIWEQPTESELIAIWEIVTTNGLHPATDYCWGAAGCDWAPTI